MKKVRLTGIIMFLIMITGLFYGCGRLETGRNQVNSDKRAITALNQTQTISSGDFINCSQAYQSESGVNSDTWGHTIDSKLRQLSIRLGKYQDISIFALIGDRNPDGLASGLLHKALLLVIQMLLGQ